MSADFMTWLTSWLRRHPVQSPPQDPAYTAEVMARVTTPAPATEPAQSSLARKCRAPLSARPFRWVVRPRLSWALATVAACGMALGVVQRQPSRIAKAVERDVEVLSALGDVDPLAGAELEQDVVLMDRMMLAQAQGEAQDDVWLEETLELLSEVEEDAVEGSGTESADELLEEMEMLDEHDMASS